MCNNEIETTSHDVKLGSNGLIGLECCFGPDSCFREQVQTIQDRCLYYQPEFPVQYCGTHWFVPGYLLQAAALQQINPGLQGPLGGNGTRCYSAIHHMQHGLSQVASPTAGGGVLSDGVRALAGWHKHPPPLASEAMGATPFPGALQGHTRSKESPAEPALRQHPALQAKWPRRNLRPRPLHLSS